MNLEGEVYEERLQFTVETACASELKTVYPPMGKKNHNYWWSEELTKLRRVVTMTRRRAQRPMVRGNSDAALWTQE
jgi:hypothetical protein